MSFSEFIKEFFRFTSNYSGNYLDAVHLTIASIVTAVTIFLGTYLGIKNKNKDEETKVKVILPFAIAMWAFYFVRIIMIVARSGWKQYFTGDLPLFLCDIQYFTLIAVCFGKGRIRKAGLDFTVCLGILTLAMGVWLNAGTFGGNPWWSSCYIYEMAVHAIPGGLAFYIMFSRLDSLRIKDIWITLLILLAFEAIALTVDYSIDANYMFFRSDSGTPFFIFRNWAGDNDPLYSFFVWCGMTLYVVLYYAVWELIRLIVSKIKEKKAA